MERTRKIEPLKTVIGVITARYNGVMGTYVLLYGNGCYPFGEDGKMLHLPQDLYEVKLRSFFAGEGSEYIVPSIAEISSAAAKVFNDDSKGLIKEEDLRTEEVCKILNIPYHKNEENKQSKNDKNIDENNFEKIEILNEIDDENNKNIHEEKIENNTEENDEEDIKIVEATREEIVLNNEIEKSKKEDIIQEEIKDKKPKKKSKNKRKVLTKKELTNDDKTKEVNHPINSNDSNETKVIDCVEENNDVSNVIENEENKLSNSPTPNQNDNHDNVPLPQINYEKYLVSIDKNIRVIKRVCIALLTVLIIILSMLVFAFYLNFNKEMTGVSAAKRIELHTAITNEKGNDEYAHIGSFVIENGKVVFKK